MIKDEATNEPSVAAGGLTWLWSGLIAWLGLLGVVYLLSSLMGLPPAGLSFFVGDAVTGSSAAAKLWAGRALLLGFALLWAALYPRVRSALPRPEWTRGLLYGLAIWAFSLFLLIPLAAWLNGTLAAGRFQWMRLLGTGYGGYEGLAMSLAAHIVYGLLLATVYNRSRAASWT